ncbi:FAS1 domain-containing protein [Marasmius fiardii PR-910]|nr:FAS1 domain-containing protein [Marasmius fiardii PR-910]
MLLRNVLLATLIATSVAQNDPLTGISQALNANGLTAFAGLLPIVNRSTVGQGLFRTLLSGGNFSIFVPNNQAISQVPQNIAGDSDALANIISYHILQGNFTDPSGSVLGQNLPNVTIGRTLLNDSSLVQLEGNRSQVLVWGKESGGAIRILNQPSNTTVQNVTSIGGFGVYAIDRVLTIPPSFSQALAASPGLSTDALVALLNNTLITGADGSNISFTSFLDGSAVRGFTFFAPNNAALQAAQSTLATLQGNATAVQVVLGNHIVNGSSLYSTTLANTTSASGEPLTFFSNSSGSFVSSGNVATARIVATNVLAKNGVVHVIDGVLANTQSDSSAASSAFQGATSTAPQTATETGPVSNPTGTGSGGGNNGSGGSGNGALSVFNENLISSMLLVVGTIVSTAFMV